MTVSDSFDLTLVMDRSGSMQSIRSDTEGAIAKFMASQAAIPGKCVVSLYQFDEHFERVFSAVDVKAVSTIKLEPRGWTALLDATARAIDETGARLAATPEAERPGRVLFVIITDGQENSSKEHTFQTVKDRIEKQTSAFKWEFVFLGAGLDSFAQGAQMGVRMSSNYTPSTEGIEHAYASLDCAISDSRTRGVTLSVNPDLTV